jgi:rubrerythrin
MMCCHSTVARNVLRAEAMKTKSQAESYNGQQMTDLLYQALETELGGEQVYVSAISAAINRDLRKEWEKYLEDTKHHQEVLLGVFQELKLDPKAESPSRSVVRHLGKSLVAAIELAKKGGDPAAAQLAAAECVVLAETKDHMNWELIGHVAEHAKGPWSEVLKRAFKEVETDEDHHLYHTKGWTRELWIESLGLSAVLPPPEEVKKVDTAIGAARAEKSREQMTDKRARA